MIPRFACMEADISIRSYHRWREDGKFLFEKRDEGEEPADAEGDMKMQFYIETEKALGAHPICLAGLKHNAYFHFPSRTARSLAAVSAYSV